MWHHYKPLKEKLADIIESIVSIRTLSLSYSASLQRKEDLVSRTRKHFPRLQVPATANRPTTFENSPAKPKLQIPECRSRALSENEWNF